MKYVFEARVKLGAGRTQKVTVEADNHANAKAMLEAQYGKGNAMNITNKGPA